MNNTNWNEDQKLVERVVKGDKGAITLFYQSSKKHIIAAVLKASGGTLDKQKLSDIVQEIYYSLFRNHCGALKTYKQKSGLMTFVYTIAYRKALYLIYNRKEGNEEWGAFEEESHGEEEKISQTMGIKKIVITAKKNLTSDEFELFMQLYIEGYLPKEIAQERGVSATAISCKKNRIGQKLKMLLQEQEITL